MLEKTQYEAVSKKLDKSLLVLTVLNLTLMSGKVFNSNVSSGPFFRFIRCIASHVHFELYPLETVFIITFCWLRNRSFMQNADRQFGWNEDNNFCNRKGWNFHQGNIELLNEHDNFILYKATIAALTKILKANFYELLRPAEWHFIKVGVVTVATIACVVLFLINILIFCFPVH